MSLSEEDKAELLAQGFKLPPEQPSMKREEKPSEDGWASWIAKRTVGAVAKGASSDMLNAVVGLPYIAGKTVYNRAAEKDNWGDALKAAAIPDEGVAMQADIVAERDNFLRQNPTATNEQVQNFLNSYIQSDDYYHKTQESLAAPLRWAAKIEEGINTLVGETRKPDQMTSADELTELATQGAIGLSLRNPTSAAKLPASLAGKVAKYAAKGVELATPFTVPYSAGNVAANVGVGAAINQGIRYATDQETVLDGVGDAATAGAAGAGAVGLAAVLGKAGKATQVAKGITREGTKEFIDVPAGAVGGAQTIVRDIGPQGPGGLYSRAMGKVKTGLDEEAPVRAAVREVSKDPEAPGDVDDIAASAHGASFFKRVKQQADEWVIEPVRNYQRMSPDAQKAWDEYANLHVLLDRRKEALKLADDAMLDAGTAFRRAPTKANLDAYQAAQEAVRKIKDDEPETRLVMPQYTTKEAEQLVAKMTNDLPELKQHLNLVDRTTKRILNERVGRGIDDPQSAQNLQRFFYYGRQWQDEDIGRSWWDRAMRGEKQRGPEFQALTRDARRVNTDDVSHMVTMPGASMEALVQYAQHSASLLERNASHTAIMKRLGLQPTNRNAVKEIDPTKHVVTFDKGKEQVWQVPEGLAKGLNVVADNLSMAEKMMQVPRVWLQRGYTGALGGPAALMKQLLWAMPSAVSLARAGSGISPVTVARGMARAAVAGEPVHHMIADIMKDFRTILIQTESGKRLISAFGQDPKKVDDWLWTSSQNMKRFMLEDALTLGLDPESMVGHTVEKVAGLRSRVEEITGSKLGAAGRLATFPLSYPLKAWINFFETMQSGSRLGAIAQEMTKAKKQYGSVDQIPKKELARIEMLGRETEGDLIRMSGSRTMRFLQRTVPYARVQMAGYAIMSKRLRAAFGMDPTVKPFSVDHLDAFSRVMMLGVAPAVAAAYLASRSPGTSNYYWNVMPRYERERNMLFPDPAHPDFFDTFSKWHNGELMDFEPEKFMKMPIPPDFGPLTSAIIQSMPAMGMVPAGTVEDNPTAWSVVRNTLADVLGGFVPTAVTAGASLFGGKINMQDAIAEGTNPFRGGQQSTRIDPGATSGVSSLEDLPYVGASAAAMGTRIKDVAMALGGLFGVQMLEGLETGASVHAAAKKAGEGKDKWSPLKQGVEGFIDEYWQQQMDKMPDGPGVWSLTERVKTFNAYSKALREAGGHLREASQYYTQVAGNPQVRNPETIRDPLTQQIIGELTKKLGNKTPYGQLGKQLDMLRAEIDITRSATSRASISPTDRAQMGNNIARRTLIAQMQQKDLLDKNVESIQQAYGEAFKQQYGVPLTLENLAAVSRRLLIGKAPQQ